MKHILLLLLLLFGSICRPPKASAQAQEIAQLALNIEKLSQFKQILEDLKKGYDILYKGYNTIKKISEGNFKLHKGFLDALLKVSPQVRNYHKVAGIIQKEIALVSESKSAISNFRAQGQFSASEVAHIEKVYGNLISLSIRNLDELSNVITQDRLRMSDDERLKAIDHIFEQMDEHLVFLRHFNGNNSVLAAQRAKEKNDASVMQQIQGTDL